MVSAAREQLAGRLRPLSTQEGYAAYRVNRGTTLDLGVVDGDKVVDLSIKMEENEDIDTYILRAMAYTMLYLARQERELARIEGGIAFLTDSDPQNGEVISNEEGREIRRVSVLPNEPQFTEEQLAFHPNVHVLQHPFAQNHLSKIREASTDTQGIRHHGRGLTNMLIVEATSDVSQRVEMITTGTGVEMRTPRLDTLITAVPVARAGYGMFPSAWEFLPQSPFGFSQLARDEKTAQADMKSWKVPEYTVKGKEVIILDPMLATGGTAELVIEEIMKGEPRAVKLVCWMAAPEGINRIVSRFENVQIYTAAVDSHLDHRGYIKPGGGDIGDRLHGTNGDPTEQSVVG